MKALQGQDPGPLTTIRWRLLRDKILDLWPPSDEGSSGTRSWTFDHHQMKAPQGQDPGVWPHGMKAPQEQDGMKAPQEQDPGAWPHGMKAPQGQDEMKAPQGQDAGAWPPWDKGFSGTRSWSMTTMGWRLLRDKMLEHDHHGSQHWQLLVTMTTLSFVGWPVNLCFYMCCHAWLHMLSYLTTCGQSGGCEHADHLCFYMCCHAWLLVLSCLTTCAVMPDYMCFHARLHVLSCPTTCAVTPDYMCCHTWLQVVKVMDVNMPTTYVLTCAVMPDYMCCHAWLQVVKVTDVNVPTTWSPQPLDHLAAQTLKPADRYLLYAPNSSLINSMMADVNFMLSNDSLGSEWPWTWLYIHLPQVVWLAVICLPVCPSVSQHVALVMYITV